MQFDGLTRLRAGDFNGTVAQEALKHPLCIGCSAKFELIFSHVEPFCSLYGSTYNDDKKALFLLLYLLYWLYAMQN